MKQIKILLAGFAAMAISFVSCTNDFESANANPNELNEINPEYLFNTSSYYTLNAFCGSMKKVLLANYSHYYGGATGGQVQRYGNQGSTNDSYWKNVYNYAIFPVHFIQTQMENDEQYHNRVLIAKIWENYLFSQAVSIWGGIPKSQAFNAGERVPYDKESDIYYAMLNDLKACADGLKMDGDVYKADPIFPSGQKSSDLLKWKKFANSLRLRLAVRICNADRSKATEVIDELMENEQNLMTSNEDNCLLQWGDNADTRNYFYDYLVINRESNLDKLHSAGESILMYMAPYADPRLEKFFTPANAASMPDNFHWAPYWGQPKVYNLPSGVSLSPNPHSGKTADDYSQLQDKFTEQSYAEVIMNYAEVCLLKSELVHKGLGSGSQTAEAYYNAGVNASMAQYGVDGGKVNNYLQTPGIKWNTLTDLTVTEEGEDYYKDFIGIVSSAITSDEPDPIYRQIIMQQYIAMFYQSLDAWTLIRRSQVLEFPPHFQPETGYGAVNAGTKDNPYAYIPQRLVYPDSEKTNNEYELTKGIANLDGGQDAMSTKLWFALPTKTNPYLTNN
ncbi:SusD/RagB family nutrient-binding outer membrane lipoprotein [Bacteroides sp.]|uniref:SusD/RagB family nutrient-binding outer membrane lipoprotein n=1 Tax=Bacteroides sp. TaxID=29523 RepID=UPI0031FE11DB